MGNQSREWAEVIMENMHEVTKHCHEKLEADAHEDRDDRVW